MLEAARTLALCVVAGLILTGCQSFQESFSPYWEEYKTYPPHKAMALAKDPIGGWAVGYGHGWSSEDQAIQGAMSECRARRVLHSVSAPCELYAVGDRVVYGAQYEPTSVPAPIAPSAPEKTRSEGTCFAVRSDGTLLTALHVVDAANAVTVVLSDGTEARAETIRVSRALDLAVLRVEEPTANYLDLAGPTSPSLGETVFTLGFPVRSLLGDEPKYTAGEVSSLSGPGGDASFIQVSVPLQPGNSGGPLVNSRGEAVGIITSTVKLSSFVTATGTLPQNVNWAVRADLAAHFFEATKTRQRPTENKRLAIDRARRAICHVTADSLGQRSH